jgi:hypothetical protein
VLRFSIPLDGLDAESLAPMVEFMGKKPVPVETVADNAIIDRLSREGFIEKLYQQTLTENVDAQSAHGKNG